MVAQTGAGTGLPEKEWFSVQEIADRWGCEVEQLTHYAAIGWLQVCFNFRRAGGISRTIWSRARGEEAELTVASLPNGYLEGIFGIQSHDIDFMIREGGVYPGEVYWKDQQYTRSYDISLYSKDLLEKDDERYHFIVTAEPTSLTYEFMPNFQRSGHPIGPPNVDYVVPEKLLVTRKERDRFEEKHRIGDHAGAMPRTDREHTWESEKLRLLIRASREFWSTAVPDDRTTHSRNGAVVEWLIEKELSKKLAEAGATFIRPKRAVAGRPTGHGKAADLLPPT